ncbi:MAG TPA: hypothetical protein VF710_16715 [Longimicrobium sp.]|jgi:hypothetical protein
MIRDLVSTLLRPSRSPADEQLRVDDAGVELRDERGPSTIWRIGWNEIEEIGAFKRDMLTVDDLCLGFRGSSGWLVCDEETAGWGEVSDALAVRFGVRFEDWSPLVATPAFAENWVVLWRRPAAPPDSGLGGCNPEV